MAIILLLFVLFFYFEGMMPTYSYVGELSGTYCLVF